MQQTAEGFVKSFYLEKMLHLEDAFNTKTGVGKLIDEMKLDSGQQQKLKKIIDTLLTDAFYSILSGLDGEHNIGATYQHSYKISDEEGNVINPCGDLELYIDEYFGHNDE